jgi:signal transduction histidine kinase
VVNALDALPHGGTLFLRVSRYDQGSVGRITIADTGVGISLEHRQSIFEPFFTTKKDVGTGLGLWVAQEIVRKYEGEIRMRSSVRPGASGTVFSVFLPAIPAAVDETTAQCA